MSTPRLYGSRSLINSSICFHCSADGAGSPGFATLQDYFDGYSIAGQRLAGLRVPASILMAQDDPVIPFASFQHWQLPPHARLETARWGGHCGFLENLRGDGFAERWVARRLAAAATGE